MHNKNKGMQLGLKMFYAMRIKFYTLLMFLIIVTSCAKDTKIQSEISKIPLDFTVERFDKAFLNTNPKNFKQLKKAYPFLFSKHESDSLWIQRMQDTLQQELLAEVNTSFKNFESEKQQLKQLFQHLKYYDKLFKTPRVITLTNDVDYRTKTIVNDSLLLIALDNFLGPTHRFYQNIPKYLSANMDKSQIVVTIADAYAKKYTPNTRRSTFLDEIIYQGKLLYFKDLTIPFKTEAERISYTQAQLDWAKSNELQIWTYFIEKELLYSSDKKLIGRFIADAPFSKFYLELDNESPGRLGQYIGWQIVKRYAEKSDKDLMQILQEDTEEIFRISKFKPRK